ncbi:efflux RND transporter periplasmic adaptor subunit [Aliikangiella sp. IMCC44359]|uniref:efflux RND transporter periplasmic adaptor subunit n=1 Tax=Aliikangiella sp. IMCC44359 TaxID=3459125 RepID=UPI00403B15D8
MSLKKSAFIGITIVLVGILIIAVMVANKPEPPKKPVKDVFPLVEVISPEAKPTTFEVEAHGVVMPRTETTLVSEVSGVIQQVSDKFVVGGFFRQGEILLQIEATDYEVGVEQAKARLASERAKHAQEKAKAEQAKKEWDLTGRSRENAPIIALREPFLLEAKANVLSAEADLKKAEQKLARTVIRAPYDGMVKVKSADVGQFVATGTQLGSTFAIDYAEVRLPLTDQDLAFIEVPDWKNNNIESKVVLTANYAGEKRLWKGKLVRMEGVVDAQSRVHYVVVRVADPYAVLNENNQAPPLKIGSFVTAIIQGKKEDNLVKIPREAFKDLNNVLVSDKDNKLYKRRLEVVRSQANDVYVRSGLQQGDRIVMTSIESPVQGMSLRISGETEPEKVNSPEEKKESYAQKNQ